MKKILSILVLILSPINKSFAAITVKFVGSDSKVEIKRSSASEKKQDLNSGQHLYESLKLKQRVQTKESSEGTDCRDTRTPNG